LPTWPPRDATPADAAEIDRVALAAFGQYRDLYDDWPAFSRILLLPRAAQRNGGGGPRSGGGGAGPCAGFHAGSP